MRFIPLILFLVAIGASGEACNVNDIENTYTYHLGGKSGGRIPYEKQLSSLLLDQSSDKFGNVKLSISKRVISPERARLELNKGVQFHFLTGGIIEREVDEKNSFILEKPILQNFLGYRQLIVRKERLAEFEAISSWDELLKLTAGQAAQWPDVKILEEAGVKVVGGGSYQSLFPMLLHKRFDYLSLGAGEIFGSLEKQEQLKEHFAVVENIVIYYPWPIYYFVSRTCPNLYDRLKYSMEKTKKNGRFETLFESHYGDEIRRLNKPSTKVFVIDNPNTRYAPQYGAPTLLDAATIIPRN